MDLSHNRSCINLDVDSRLRGIFASKNRQVDHSFPILSSVLCGKTQSWTSNTIQFLEDFNLFTHFFSGTRHLGFEDVQAMVDLISDPRQISGLLVGVSLNDLLVDFLFQLHHVGFFPCNPLASSRTTIQGVETQAIRRCNEASTLPTNEVFLNGFPVHHQCFRHGHSLYTQSCTMQAFFESMNLGSHALPPQPFGSIPKGEGEQLRIRSMTTNQRSNQ